MNPTDANLPRKTPRHPWPLLAIAAVIFGVLLIAFSGAYFVSATRTHAVKRTVVNGNAITVSGIANSNGSYTLTYSLEDSCSCGLIYRYQPDRFHPSQPQGDSFNNVMTIWIMQGGLSDSPTEVEAINTSGGDHPEATTDVYDHPAAHYLETGIVIASLGALLLIAGLVFAMVDRARYRRRLLVRTSTIRE
ncbi:MAG TPA: hypothetical protein VMV29_04770 [Ktedonobacterales bacterium]|nr:hypothetical protein [Ktedonobacterales bacterium]